ncbi:MAG: hypothetical protein ACOX17_00500 [Christensenellales bacterium]|jgi:hypothetical protein
MKKLPVFFTALLLVFLLSACSLIPAGLLPFKNSSEPTEGPIASETEAPSAEEADTPETENPEDEGPAAEAAVPEEISFEEMVVIDNDECCVKITALTLVDTYAYELDVLLENKSGEKAYVFSTEGGAVNGVEYDLFLYKEVAPGKAETDAIFILLNTLEDTGITGYSDFELTFKVYDPEDLEADPVARVTTHVYPYGKEKAAVFVRKNQPTDTVLFDDENVTVIVIGYEKDNPDWGFIVHLYMVNKTDNTLLFAEDNASVNGFMCDPYWAREVRPGKVAFSSMFWFKETIEALDITEVEEIEMLFSIYDADDWGAGKLIEEVVVLTP